VRRRPEAVRFRGSGGIGNSFISTTEVNFPLNQNDHAVHEPPKWGLTKWAKRITPPNMFICWFTGRRADWPRLRSTTNDNYRFCESKRRNFTGTVRRCKDANDPKRTVTDRESDGELLPYRRVELRPIRARSCRPIICQCPCPRSPDGAVPR
jgi:hypothetical protein